MDNLIVFKDVKDYFDEVLDCKQFVIGERNLPEFPNKLRKFLFFALREGVAETLKKYKSLQWYNRHIEKYATFMLLRKGTSYFVSCSLQSQIDQNKFILNSKFFKIIKKEDFENIIKADELKGYDFLKYFNQYETSNLVLKGLEESIEIPKNYSLIKEENSTNGLIIFGLGGYAFTHILPGLKHLPRLACVDYKAERSMEFSERFDFKHALYHPYQTKGLLESCKEPVVVIATYHSDHSLLAKWVHSINPNTRIFIEKPPCVTNLDLNLLRELYNSETKLEIGFNRRYVKLNNQIKSIVTNKQIFVTFSIKEVLINSNHWYNWDNQGTRLTGNLVHWIDLGNFWVDEDPISLTMNFSGNSLDDFNLSIAYKNGSLVNITCSDKGNSLRGVQELAEIRYENDTILVEDNLKFTHIKSSGKKTVKRYFRRDKGHKRMYLDFSKNLEDNKFNYTFKHLESTSMITTTASNMLQNEIHVIKF